MITAETRRESFRKIKPVRSKRHTTVYETLLGCGPMTANELATDLWHKGITPFFSRNYVHPRLNELVAADKVEVIGKRYDPITSRTCAVYKAVE